jgi:class 3 adenylate cyclase
VLLALLQIAIFGFCDIRNFTDTTEVLQEEVMEYVNTIAHIVHTAVAARGGAANKNIGDAFLLVWKMPKGLRSRDINLMSVTGSTLSSNGCSRRPSMAAARPAGTLSLSSGIGDLHGRYSKKEAEEEEEGSTGEKLSVGELPAAAEGHGNSSSSGAGGETQPPVEATRTAASLSIAAVGQVSSVLLVCSALPLSLSCLQACP